MLKNDVQELEKILKEAGEGSPDLINEDYTSDCLCNRYLYFCFELKIQKYNAPGRI